MVLYLLAALTLLQDFIDGFQIRSLALENLPDHGQQGSSSGNQGSLSSPMLHLAIEPFLKDGATLAYRRPGRLHQCGQQPLVGTFDRDTLLLSCRAMIARADTSPTGQMTWTGELGHIASGFGQNDGRGLGPNAWNGLQQLVLAFQRLQFFNNPLSQFAELLFEKDQVVQTVLDHPALMRVQAMAFQGLDQGLLFLA